MEERKEKGKEAKQMGGEEAEMEKRCRNGMEKLNRIEEKGGEEEEGGKEGIK